MEQRRARATVDHEEAVGHTWEKCVRERGKHTDVKGEKACAQGHHAVGCPCGHGVGGVGEMLGQRRKPEGPKLLIPYRELGNISHTLRER
jgi:hypothetical protein